MAGGDLQGAEAGGRKGLCGSDVRVDLFLFAVNRLFCALSRHTMPEVLFSFFSGAWFVHAIYHWPQMLCFSVAHLGQTTAVLYHHFHLSYLSFCFLFFASLVCVISHVYVFVSAPLVFWFLLFSSVIPSFIVFVLPPVCLLSRSFLFLFLSCVLTYFFCFVPLVCGIAFLLLFSFLLVYASAVLGCLRVRAGGCQGSRPRGPVPLPG